MWPFPAVNSSRVQCDAGSGIMQAASVFQPDTQSENRPSHVALGSNTQNSCNFFISGQISKKVGAQIETILHIVLKFQVYLAYFPKGEASAQFGGKVQYKEEGVDNPQ